MKKIFKPITNQNGSMILIALMLLVILTVMGISSSTTSVVENQIAVNEQLHKMAFYHADSGIYTAAKIISFSIDESEPTSDDGFEFVYLAGEEEFYERITKQADTGEIEDGIFSFLMDDGMVRVDVFPIGTALTPGTGGAEFGVGASGHMGKGELLLFFRVFSEGTAIRNSTSTVVAAYRKVIGHTEGL